MTIFIFKGLTNHQTLVIKKLSDWAYIPIRESIHAAEWDLKSAYDAIVPKQGQCLVKTDIAVKLPSNCNSRLAPKSGQVYNHFIDLGVGVIDAKYGGNIQVLLFNHSENDYYVLLN